MKKKQVTKAWVFKPQPPKYTANEKKKILEETKTSIGKLSKTSKKVSRIDMRGNRIYLYELVEQHNPQGAIFIKPLIEDKYLEFPYARITLHDIQGNVCTADWQRHNNQWMTLHSGTLAECLAYIENDTTWY